MVERACSEIGGIAAVTDRPAKATVITVDNRVGRCCVVRIKHSVLLRLWLTGFRSLNVDLRTIVNLVGATPHDRVALLQRAEHFYEFADTRAAAHVDPLNYAVIDSNHEGPLGGRDDARGWYQQRRLWSSHEPLHFGIHTSAQPNISVAHIQFDRHRSGLLVEVVRNAAHDTEKLLAG